MNKLKKAWLELKFLWKHQTILDDHSLNEVERFQRLKWLELQHELESREIRYDYQDLSCTPTTRTSIRKSIPFWAYDYEGFLRKQEQQDMKWATLNAEVKTIKPSFNKAVSIVELLYIGSYLKQCRHQKKHEDLLYAATNLSPRPYWDRAMLKTALCVNRTRAQNQVRIAYIHLRKIYEKQR